MKTFCGIEREIRSTGERDNRWVKEKERMVRWLKDKAMSLGRAPRPAECTGKDEPFDLSLVLEAFGSWSAALEAAGIRPPERARRRFSRGITADQCLASLRNLAHELGRRPTVDDLNSETAIICGCPSYGTLRLIFGSFRAALNQAGLETAPSKRQSLRATEADGRAAELERALRKQIKVGWIIVSQIPGRNFRERRRNAEMLRDRFGVRIVNLRTSNPYLMAVLRWLQGQSWYGVLPDQGSIEQALGARAWGVLTEVLGGKTFVEVAEKFGVSGEGARQILIRACQRAVFALKRRFRQSA